MTTIQTKTLYDVTPEGTILRAETHISEQHALPDQVFASLSPWTGIIGCNLFSFIEGIEVRRIYRMFHERILREDCKISFDYRCDGPAVRRDMSMSLSRENNLVRYESTVLKETQRTVPIPMPSRAAPLIIAVCSNCKKYQYPSNSQHWKEIDLILSEPALPEQFNFTHTFCDICYRKLMDEACSM